MERLFQRGREFGLISDSLGFCCGELSGSYLAVGTDSSVYKWRGSVIKVYNGEKLRLLPPDELKIKIGFYTDVMNRASGLANMQKWKVTLPLSGIAVPVNIVPVDRIIECSCCRTPATVSKFIDGRNLEEGGRRNLPFDFRELEKSLPLFSLAVGEKLGVYGISIVPVNIKYEDGRLIVTDLCADLSILGKIP